jgi:hypothetical protein
LISDRARTLAVIKLRATRRVRELGFLAGFLGGLVAMLITIGAVQVHLCRVVHPRMDWLACLRPMVGR